MERVYVFITILMLQSFFICSNAQNSDTVNGKIIDIETKKTIDNVIITLLKNQKSILNHTDGSFDLNVETKDEMTLMLHCSRIGYYDTILKCKDVNQPLLVKLRPKLYCLDEVVITANRKNYQIGSYDTVKILNNGVRLYKENHLGVYVKGRKEYKSAQLTSISFYIQDKSQLESEVALRILSAKHRVKPNRMDDINETLDVLKEPVICAVFKKGWNEIDLRKYNIKLPHKGFFVYFTPILKKNQSVKDRLSLALCEIKSKDTPFYYAYYLKRKESGIVGYSNVSGFKTNLIPLVVIHYEKGD